MLLRKIFNALAREVVAIKVTILFLLRRRSLRSWSAPGNIKVIVSLTSYMPRFGTLQLTIKTLLLQNPRADRVILWLSDSDRKLIPRNVIKLQKYGLTIERCEDIGSYKKIIPALISYPDATVVTADDDAYYWPSWLEELIEAGRNGGKEIVCHRAHKLDFDIRGGVLPYSDWEFETLDRNPSPSIFPTGVGGVLYKPGILHSDVLDQNLFRQICPSADDLWLFWMGLRNGVTYRKIGNTRRLLTWRGSQKVGLYLNNVHGVKSNDKQVDALVSHFGVPEILFKHVQEK